MKHALNYILSLTLTLSPLSAAYADASSGGQTNLDADTKAVMAVTQVVAADGTPVEISVTAIESGDEEKLIAELAAQSPDGVIVLDNVSTAANAATNPIFEATEYVANPESKTFLGKIKNKVKSFVSRHTDRVNGTLIAISSASTGGFGAYYLAGSSLENSVYLAASMFTVATLQATFTKSWSKYLAKGGQAAQKLGEVVAKTLNRDLKNSEIMANIGEIAAAATFNIAATTTILNLTDAHTSIATTALIGLLGAYDYTVDIATRKFMKAGKFTEKQTEKTIKGRVMVGPILETLSLAGFAPARIVMGVIGITGLVTIFKGESAYDAIIANKGKFLKVHMKTRQVGKLLMRPQDAIKLLAATPDKQKCKSLLGDASTQWALADDIQ